MIAGSDKANFFVAHYEWVVAGVGALALLASAAYYTLSLGADADEAASEAVSRIERKKPAELGVEKTDLTSFAAATRATRQPQTIAEIADRQESFLASEKRVKCVCGKVMISGLETCPACGVSLVTVNQVDEEAKKAAAWAKKFGVALDATDADNDGFTNEEEYAMGTDPTDPKDHADYFDSLQLQLPLKETYVPFYLKAVNKIPAGYRCEFVQKGVRFSATVGEDLVIVKTSGVGKETKTPTGFKLIAAEVKERKVELKGVAGSKTVDASTVTIERASDGKKLDLVVQLGKPKPTPVDVQATIVYTRGTAKTFDVVAGGSIDLNGTIYKVIAVKALPKGAEVVLENTTTGKKQTLKTLD